MKALFIGIICLLLFIISCQNDVDKSASNKEVLSVLPIPDSTVYYDSVYAPLRYQLDTFFLNRHQKTEFYGQVLFAEKGRIIFQNVYGNADLTSKDTLTLEHTFQLASASKPFTAIAILQLYEKGLLHLTDDVRKFIPDFPYENITIHQLLCHRSGLSQYTHFCDSPDTIWPDKNKTITNNDVLDIIKNRVPSVNYPPNHTHYYCNTNYMLLASIVENVSGISFNEYLKKNIFEKAGMEHTTLYTRENKQELHLPVKGYTGNYTWAGDIYLNGVVGDKGVYSNVGDLYKFDQALYEGTLLNTDTLKIAFKEHNELQTNGQNYGYGFRMYPKTNKGDVVFHTGWWEGFRTYFIRVPEREQTIIILTNIKRGPFFNVMDLVNLLP
jgi:CubicO group peptidase (beta-lactamase class C family)